MSTQILIIAHAPLAQALRECAIHVYPECAGAVVAIDVEPHAPPEETLSNARIALNQAGGWPALVLTDVFGATPANIAKKLVEGCNARLIAGVNLPMLLRSVCYRQEPLDVLAERAVTGGSQGVMQVPSSAPSQPHSKTA